MKRHIVAVLLLACTGPALADRPAADQCAAGLSGDARKVYDATAPGLASAADKRSYVSEKVKGMVMGGQLSLGAAKPAAEAAAKCLAMI